MDKKTGYLIVIEGIDGSGKTVQIELLKQALTSQGVPWEAISFPRYEDNVYGKLVGRYLAGEFGQIDEVSPYLMALAFAGDRLLTKPLIGNWLAEGKWVLSNRYVSSNKAYLAARLPKGKREEFINWLDELEYKTNGMPGEDLTILLTVDPKIGQKNVLKGGKTDIHEASLRHLKEADKIYLELAKKEPNWYVVDCMKGGKMRSPEDIHKQILTVVKKCFKSLRCN